MLTSLAELDRVTTGLLSGDSIPTLGPQCRTKPSSSSMQPPTARACCFKLFDYGQAENRIQLTRAMQATVRANRQRAEMM